MLDNTIKETIPALITRIVEAAQAPFTDAFNGLPGLVLGNMGAGKSAAFYETARRLRESTGDDWQVVDIRALLYDPVELKGIQTVKENSDFAVVLKPDWAANLDPDGHYLIVFEEVTKALPSVQSALMQVILDRRVAGFEFGRNWVPFATGNLSSSRSGDIPMPAALRDRFWIVIAEHSAKPWLDWAVGANLRPEVTSFIKANPDMLDTWDSEQDPLVFATARSLHFLSNAVEVAVDPKSWGIPYLGQEAGVKFAAHVDALAILPDPEVIFNDPEHAPVMPDIGTAFYLGASLSYWVDKGNFDALTTYARRCAHEVAQTMVSEAVSRHPECQETAAYIAFQCDYDPQQS